MEPARQPANRDQVRAAVRSRYGGLARAAQAGQTVTDCGPGAVAAAGFGAAGSQALLRSPDSLRRTAAFRRIRVRAG